MKYGDVLRHPQDHYKSRVMFIGEETATILKVIVLHDEDALIPPENKMSKAWSVGIIKSVSKGWLKVER